MENLRVIKGIDLNSVYIDSLPNLIEIEGLSIDRFSDDKSLDKLFASCGHSLQKLDLIIMQGGLIPQALKRYSNFRELTLAFYG